LRTLLINPPCTIHKRFFKSAESFPLGLASVAASCRQRGHEVRILDAFAEGHSNRRREGDYVHAGLADAELARKIREFDPELIGIASPFSVQLHNALQVARLAREAAPRATLVGGGAHATAMPATFPPGTLDYLVLGEGEVAFGDLADRLPLSPDDALPPGVMRCGAAIDGAPVLAPPPDLSEIPGPAYDLLPMPLYWRLRRYAKVLATRGCPFTCSFCSVHVTHGREIRKRPIEAVVDELSWLERTYALEQVDFEDDNLTAQMGWAKRFFERMAQASLRARYYLRDGIRADRVDLELLQLMKRAGVAGLAVAPETGCQELLDEVIGKRLRLEDVEKAVQLAAGIGLEVTCFLVIGFPRETLAQVHRTIEYGHHLRRLGATRIWLSCAAPHPGTALWEECRELGLVSDDMDLRLVRDPPALIRTSEFTPEQIGQLRDRAMRAYHPSRARTFVTNGLRTAVTDPGRFVQRIGQLLRPGRNGRGPG